MLTSITPPMREPVLTAEAFTHLRADPIVGVDSGHVTGSGQFNVTAHPLTVTGAVTAYPNADFAAGRLYKIESEILEATAVSGNDVTFARGLADTAIAAHADGVALYRASPSDDEIRSLLVMAREVIEQLEWRSHITQTWKLTLDRFPPIDTSRRDAYRSTIFLPRPPVQSVSSVVYLDAAGTQQTLDPADYRLAAASEPGRLDPAYGKTWPSTYGVSDAVEVTYVAGYGSNRPDVPERTKQAIKLMIGEMYWNREVMQTIQVREAPVGIRALLDTVKDERVLPFV